MNRRIPFFLSAPLLAAGLAAYVHHNSASRQPVAAAVRAAAGTIGAVLTGRKQVHIPAETVLSFTLRSVATSCPTPRAVLHYRGCSDASSF
jgi:hypothetical protein